MFKKNISIVSFVVLCITSTWHYYGHGDVNSVNKILADINPKTLQNIQTWVLNPIKDALAGFGQQMKIDLAEIPFKFTIDDKVFHQLYSLAKPLLGFGFALLGGVIIKNGCKDIGTKDQKDKAAKTQIIIGTTITIIGFTYMCLQAPK
jgi:hypothetical protein